MAKREIKGRNGRLARAFTPLDVTPAVWKRAGVKPSVNLLDPPAGASGDETIDALVRHPAFTLEHIVSRGAASPEGFWYDQDRSEWVLLLRGDAELQFESGEFIHLTAGDPLLIPAHRRHRVERTSNDAVWLALHFTED